MSGDRCMDHADAVTLVDDWVKAWNSHDREKVWSHFADEVVFTSPVAAQFLDVAHGHETYLGSGANPQGCGWCHRCDALAYPVPKTDATDAVAEDTAEVAAHQRERPRSGAKS